MAYPEPIPIIRGKKNVEEFLHRLENFKLTPEQQELYRDALQNYRDIQARKEGLHSRPL